MQLLTSARDDKLLKEIAEMFDVYASDSEAFAARGWSKRENMTRAKVWREAAEDIRRIKIVEAE